MNRAKILVLVLLVSIDAQFTENPPEIQSGCSGETIYFNWTYAISSPIFVVEWKVDGSRIAIESVATSQPFTPVAGYVGRLSKISNAQISLGPLTIADTGTYKAEVIYTNGNTADSNRTTLTVHDALNNKTEIVETSGILSPSFYDPSITYTWRSPDNVISTGQYLPVSISGNYTLCVSEGKASCLNSAIDPCASKYVEKVNDCSLDIFLYGFLPDFLIVLIVSIVIIIILKIECLPKQFGGLTWKKLGIIAVCFVVAIIIGVCLGLLIKGCDNKLLALCLSLLFGILLVVALISALIYYHKKFESRRDIQDGGAQDGNGSSQNNTGSNTTRTTTERVGSPASTSNVELAANLKSEY